MNGPAGIAGPFKRASDIRSSIDEERMTQFAEKSKSPMSNPAKVLLAYMRLSGQWDSRALAAEFSVPLRTIQRWKMECALCATDATGAISGVSLVHELSATGATNAISGAPQAPDMALARDLQRAHANMEYPSDILISSKEEDSPLVPQAVCAEPVVVPQAARPKIRSRGSRLDPDWHLPHEWREWARTIYPGASTDQIDDQAAQFRDYWIAKPGAQAFKLDWEATWRNWCRRGLSPLGHVRRPQHTGSWHRQKIDLVAAYGLTLVDCEPGGGA